MRTRLLVDEIPNHQHSQLTHLVELGAIVPDVEAEDEEVAWGSDPFDIVAHREAMGLTDDD